jgi:hypothetical protein
MEASNILSYITSTRLGTGEWKHSTEAFITHWENQVRIYERLVPLTDHLSDGQKRTLLENAVQAIGALNQVKVSADLEKVKTGKDLTFDEYMSLLLAAATTHDSTGKVSARRKVYLHEFQDSDEFDNRYDDADSDFDIDTPVSVLQAYAHERPGSRLPSKGNGARVRMPFDRWKAVSESGKAIWDKLSDEDKAIILTKGSSESPKRQVHFHEEHGEQNVETDHHNEAFEDARETDYDDETPDKSTLLINAAKSNGRKLPPADMRRFLSTKDTRSANVHCFLNYRVSTHNSSQVTPLCDRGANGGIAGNDVRVISYTDRTVDVEGIDRHQINNVKIGTIGGVTETTKGPVILIGHQYALYGKGSSIHSPLQMEAYGVTVNDKSLKIEKNQQRIVTPDG